MGKGGDAFDERMRWAERENERRGWGGLEDGAAAGRGNERSGGNGAGGGVAARGRDGRVSDRDGIWAGGECAGCGGGGEDICGEGAARHGTR